MSDQSPSVPLEVQGLTKKFGSFTAVDHVSFTAVSYTHLTLPTIYSV